LQLNDDLLNDFLLEAFPNPERKGCPDDDTVKAFAEDRLPPGSTVLEHIASCSECYREYKHYRQDWKEAGSKIPNGSKPAQTSEPLSFSAQKQQRSRTPGRGWAIAAGLLVVLGGGFYFALEQRHTHPPPASSVASSAAPVNAEVNLFNAVTVRGSGNDSTPIEPVTLPSSVVNLAVTLPRFSEIGPYQVLVSKDRAGKSIVARGAGNALKVDKKASLVVTLDLRNVEPGMYFLGTVRGSDNGSYYYPLNIR